MTANYYDAVDRDCAELIEQLADRPPAQQLRHLRMFSKGGEWGELVEFLWAVLLDERISITATHRKSLAALLDLLGPQKDEHFSPTNHRASTVASIMVETAPTAGN